MRNDQKTGTVMLFPTGMIAVFMNEEQVPELQGVSAAGLWAKHAESLGYDPLKFTFEETSVFTRTGINIASEKSNAVSDIANPTQKRKCPRNSNNTESVSNTTPR